MPGMHFERILVPIDFSDLSFEALEKALEIAGEERVNVVHVLPPLLAFEGGDMYGTVALKDRKSAALTALKEKLPEETYARIIPRVLVGDPGQEIAAFSQRESVGLIVIPSHGHGFFKRMWLGSVAERVLRLAHCPVLVLRS